MASLPVDFPGLRIVIKDLEKKTTVQYRSANCLISDFEVDPDITLKDSNDEQICKFSASMCEHDEQSSVQGKVECFHVPSQKMTVIINDPGKTFTQCMEELYAVLTRVAISSETPPSLDEMKEKFLRSLKLGRSDAAESEARELAKHKVEMPLRLDTAKSSNEHEASASGAVKLFQLTIVVEGLGSPDNREQVVQISVAERTTIGQLKRLIKSATGIDRQRQFWFLDRMCLTDSYAFGDVEKSVIYLTIGPPLR